MPPRSRYAVDPSLTAQTAPQSDPNQYGQPPQNHYGQYDQQPGQASQPDGYSQFHAQAQHQQQQHQQQYQQGQHQSTPQLHQLSERDSVPTGEYAPSAPAGGRQGTYHAVQTGQQGQMQPDQHIHPSAIMPQNHIPAPPHASGPQIAGPRVRIDPSQVPNPVEAQELDQNLFDDEDFMSCQTHGCIPLAGTDYRGIDQGNSLPRHLRATLSVIPTNSQLLETTALPFALIVQPFAPLRYDEAPVPLVSNWVSGESAFDIPHSTNTEEDEGPPRCEKCRGYINPWVRWIDSGRKWGCNLCGQSNIVPPQYFCNLAPTGQRLDQGERPELLHGTIDFPVPKIYWSPQPPPSGSILDSIPDSAGASLDALSSTAADLLGGLQSSLGQAPTPRGPSPHAGAKEREKLKEAEKRLRKPVGMGRVFVIDVSGPSVGRGVVASVCDGIRKALYGSTKRKESISLSSENGEKEVEEEESGLGRGERIAIVTVAETVGFWNLAPTQSGPSMMVVSDLDDMFIPLTTGFLVDPTESRSQIEGLLELLPGLMERQNAGNRCAAGAGIRGALAGLRMLGGQITLFLFQLPTVGPGKLTVRDDPSAYNTDKEKTFFASADPFWRTTAEELAECGVGVNLFLFPDSYCDIASIGTLSAITGGETFFHPKFQPVRDRDTLFEEIKRTLTRETIYNATIRVRCSNGLRVTDHIGNFYQRSLTDLEFGIMDDSKSFAAILKHEGQRLDDRIPSYVQVAVLYTSSDGERRVRCLNMSFASTSLIGNVFRFADLDAAVTVYVKDAVAQMPSKNLKDIRKSLTDRCNRVLLMYRRHCAPAVQSGQLILPEGLKLLPLFTLCILKSKPLKGGNVTSDVRAHYMRVLKSYGVTSTMNLLYPRFLAIHDLTDDIGFPDHRGKLKLPRFMRASYGYMLAEGAYLMSNGEIAMVWFGGAVSPQIIDDIYGTESIEELDTRMTRLPKLPTLLSTQIRNILSHLERVIGHSLPVMIVRQNMDGMEIEFANHLVEDSNNDALGYTDYLMTAHKSITNEMSGSGGKSDSWKVW